MKDAITVFVVFILFVHFYKIFRQRYLNKHNKCARCGIYFDGIGKHSLTASYHTFLYCDKCFLNIKKIDIRFFLISAGFAVFLILIYIFSNR